MSIQYEFLTSWLRARFGDNERAASLVEYVLLVALIGIVCIAVVSMFGDNDNK